MGSDAAEAREGLRVECRVRAGEGWTGTRARVGTGWTATRTEAELGRLGQVSGRWTGTPRATPRGRAAVSAPKRSLRSRRGPRGPEAAQSSYWRGRPAPVTGRRCRRLREGGRLSGVCVH